MAVSCFFCVACNGGSNDEEPEREPDPTGSIKAEPDRCVIPPGETYCTATLTWTFSDTDTACVFTDSGDRITCDPSGSHTVNIIAGTNNFLLKAGDDFALSTMLDSLEVEGINAPWVDAYFDPPSVIAGQGSTLKWKSEFTDSCSGVPGEDGNTETNGSRTYRRDEPGHWTETITCKGPGGTASDSATLTVERPPIWSLSIEQRRAYLQHYSPIIFKRANEDGHDQRGYDLITNFDFDRDDTFSNNKLNWEQIHRFLEGNPDVEHWRIRPTMYTAIIEFMEPEGKKSALLLYHVYHAMQQGSIHDWERIEIRIDRVDGTPGQSGERVDYVVITEHHNHKFRTHPNKDLNFAELDTGKHVLVWQAEWSGTPTDPHNAELRFVEDAWRSIEQRVKDSRKAEVEVNGDSEKKNVNYVFVCECSAAAKRYWPARAINQDNASEITAGVREKVDWNQIRPVTYELQDLADILPTHTPGGAFENHWTQPSLIIVMQSPLHGEDGSTLIDEGSQEFYYRALDDDDPDEHRNGYPYKSWFWGAYDLGGDRNLKDHAFTGDPDAFQSGTRGGASGYPDSHAAYWRQHDYFAHRGQRGPKDYQYGRWLERDWHTAASGGFDGRWIQLFKDQATAISLAASPERKRKGNRDRQSNTGR